MGSQEKHFGGSCMENESIVVRFIGVEIKDCPQVFPVAHA